MDDIAPTIAAPGNDLPAKSGDAPENSLFERLRGTAGGVLDKMGVRWQRGPGRPRKDGEPKRSDTPLNVAATAIPASGAAQPATADSVFRSNVVRRIYKSLAKALASTLDKIVFSKAEELTGDVKFAQQCVNETTVTEGEADAFGEIAAEIGAMLGADEKMMILGGALAQVGMVGTRYVYVIKNLNDRIAKRREGESPKI